MLILILICLLFIILFWYFLIPHYSLPNCNYIIWGDFYNKNSCLKEKEKKKKKVKFKKNPRIISYDPAESPSRLFSSFNSLNNSL